MQSQYGRLIGNFRHHIEQDLESLWRAQELVARHQELVEALARVRTLEGIPPTCQYCKKIRLGGADEDDPKSWIAIETYIVERSSASFSHGICPDCMKELHGAT